MTLPLVLTMGDPAGIGGEIALRAWAARQADDPPFFLVDDVARLASLSARFGLDVPVEPIARPGEAPSVFARALPVLPLPLKTRPELGRPDPDCAETVVTSIRRATRLVMDGHAGAVVTNPISKAVLYAAGFRHPGHTEFLAELTGVRSGGVMMLAAPGLRVVPVTVHVALRRALDLLSVDAITAAARTAAAALRRDFGIAAPRLAVAGLNPHAGENGALGAEEGDVIIPAIAALRAEGLDVAGPLSPDTMFTARARANYDAAICMYHDQALIPLKTLDVDRGVNVTLGLPVVRTSPDHGTAFEIAPEGRADPGSLRAALRMAGEIAACRQAAGAAE